MATLFRTMSGNRAPVNNGFVTPILGGSVAAPTYPINIKTLTTGFTRTFAADAFARFFAYVDGGGNVFLWDNSNPAVAAAQIVAQATIGSTINCLCADATYFYAVTSAFTVIKILIAAPHTVTVIAGTGATGEADGVGTAASFSRLAAIGIDPSYSYLMVWEGDSGNVRKINLTTLAVTTPYVGIGAAAANQCFAVGADGTVYNTSAESINWNRPNLTNGNIAVPGVYLGSFCIDPYSPMSFAVYYATSAAPTQLVRQIIGGVGPTVIATSANAIASGGPTGSGIYRGIHGIFEVDSVGNLLNFIG